MKEENENNEMKWWKWKKANVKIMANEDNMKSMK